MTETQTGTGKYEQLLERCANLEPVPTAVAHPCEASALAGAIEAGAKGLIMPILVGPGGEDPRGRGGSRASISARREIVDAPHSHASAAKAVELVRQGEAELLMKGSLHTDELLGAVVARETGLRTGRRISHVFIMDVPTYHKVLHRHRRARSTSRRRSRTRSTSARTRSTSRVSLGVARPKVAILAAVETVTSKMPATIDAAALCKMAERGQIKGGVLDGPLAFDNAISKDGGEDQGHHVGGRRRSRHPARAGPRGRQHPRQAAHLPGQRRQRRPRARRARADHPDQPRRQRALADRQLRASRCWPRTRGGGAQAVDGVSADHGRLRARPQRRLVEPEVLRLPTARGDGVARSTARGQIEGIGTSPRFTAKDGDGATLADETLDAAACATAAPRSTSLAAWLRARYGGARVLGVGHRVVHGGAQYRRPDASSRRRSSRSCAR